jgi:hypothetical protein
LRFKLICHLANGQPGQPNVSGTNWCHLIVGQLAGGGDGANVLEDGATSQGQRLQMGKLDKLLGGFTIGTINIGKAQKGKWDIST